MSALTGMDKTTLKAWRTSAREALHRLLIGENAQAQGYDGKTVTYTPAEAPKLRSWVDELTRAIGDGTASRGPVTPYF